MRRMTRLLCLMLLFSLITFSCPLAEETDALAGTPAPTPMLTAVPESALAPFNVVLPEDAHVEMAEGRIISTPRPARRWILTPSPASAFSAAW